MTDAERRAAAKQFAADWKGRGDEKQESSKTRKLKYCGRSRHATNTGSAQQRLNPFLPRFGRISGSYPASKYSRRLPPITRKKSCSPSIITPK